MLAFQVLYGITYQSIQTREDLLSAYRSYPTSEEKPCPHDLENTDGFAWELVEGVWSSTAKLDELITQYSTRWKIERIGHIELTILRLAFYELFFRHDTPAKVVINEAIELDTHFGEEAGKRFINGILDTAYKDITRTDGIGEE